MRRMIRSASPLVVVAVCCAAAMAGETRPAAERLRYNRDVRAILSETCFQCHGPDKNTREADLRLDLRDSAVADRGGYAAIVPGDAAASELMARIRSTDDDTRMPPADSERKLSAEQVETLARWIAEGAEYEPHWAFVPPVEPELPPVEDAAWPRNAIDHFVLARLEREGLRPSREAGKATLLRRVTLDLTGLPPTIAEVDAFLADDSADAYERVVDGLLARTSHGERMARVWLDYARYADTNGYQNDGERDMWRWRDWVIDAYNRNLPFDQFTIDQLAGDLLPEPTLDQRIATGFNRNHRGNSEGGIIPEEWLVEYVADRAETTAAVWLGVTIGCARCHDHKFDPFTQKEFYQLFAMFNNVDELGRIVLKGNSPPVIKAPTPAMATELARLDAELANAKSEVARLDADLVAAQTAWEASAAGGERLDWRFDQDLACHLPLDADTGEDLSRAIAAAQPAEEVINPESEAATSAAPLAPPVFVKGFVNQAARFDGEQVLVAPGVGDFDENSAFTLSAWIYIRKNALSGTIVCRVDEDNSHRGYELDMFDGRPRFRIIARVLDDLLSIEGIERLDTRKWVHVAATYDGSNTARGMRLYIDGRLARTRVLSNILNNPTGGDVPLRVGARPSGNGFVGMIDDVRLHAAELKAADIEALASPESISDILALPGDQRTRAQTAKLRQYFLRNQAPPPVRAAYARLDAAESAHKAYEASIPTVMVMQEMATPRPTHVLLRGEYDKPGETVTANVPACLPKLSDGLPANRLALAKWLVDPNHPLTARVAVNRFWQLYFPTGLVKTSEDFGAQGEWPSHPELLDWLAIEFVRSGWDMKHLHKLIVTSATYRQSSSATPELAKRDPENRLLARGPRFRLSADAVRDQALAISGLLVDRVGGPSVKPYQPEGLWEELTTIKLSYDTGTGEDLYRRSLYTYWKRTIPPPAMTTFDAAGRETCSVRVVRTNTPLQALALLNDVTYVEAARAMAARMIHEGGDTPLDHIAHGFRLATARRPNEQELRVLAAGYWYQLDRFAADASAASKLLSVGQSPRDERIDAATHAAMTTVAGVILNLDEVMTKE